MTPVPSIKPSALRATTRSTSDLTLTERAARSAAFRLLDRLEGGSATVKDADGERTFGDLHADAHIDVIVRDPAAYRAWLGGSASLGESYFEGLWETEDLVGLIRLLIRNTQGLDKLLNLGNRLTRPVTEPVRRMRKPDPDRDASNVRAHYDLSNEFFASFLDASMTYSSGVFVDSEVTLADAQTEKLDRLCRKLGITGDDHVVEIGTGWGSFAIHAAGTYGCKVTTTTVSVAQAELARERVTAAGLDHLIDVRLEDYRELDGPFDKLVSIEMIEAVDWRDHDDYFEACGRLLRDDGLMGLQAIVISDERYERAKNTVDFIKAHVFPGGCLPSNEVIAHTAAESGDLRVIDTEDLGAHYAETLARWRNTFLQVHNDELESYGLDERFARLWDFYLCYCEAAFAERHVSVVQTVLAARGWRSPGLAVRSA